VTRTRIPALLLALALTSTSVASCSGSSSKASPRPSTPAPHESDTQLATDAYVWGYPLVVTERTLQSLARLTPVNHLTFQPARSNVSTRTVVAPNTDTLYAVAPLDLRGEPYVLTLPRITDRYYVFQFLSAYTDSFAYVGTRATGGRAGSWAITPPGWHGTLPAGITRIASPTPQLLMLGRFLVADDADVTRVHELGRQITLEPLSSVTHTTPAPTPPPIGTPAGTPQSVAAAGIRFFDELGDALAINPPVDPRERATLASFAKLGIGPGRHPSTHVHDATVRDALTSAVSAGERRIRDAGAHAAHSSNGWVTSTDVGTYDHDALQRAVVAKIGWGANIPAEAVYAHSTGDTAGEAYDGAHDYVVHFDAGRLPPVKAFWSITLYGPDSFFVANPIDRYAVGDRTAGLQYGPGGSLDVYVQHDPPPGHEANWLPAPTGPFYLSMRLYLPDRAVLDGTYRYPVVTRVR